MQISHRLHFLFITLQCALHHFEKTHITESNVLHRFQITNIKCLYQSRLWLFCSLFRIINFPLKNKRSCYSENNTETTAMFVA